MRITPNAKYLNLPCSYVGTGCAYEQYHHKPFNEPLPSNLGEDGWSTLDNTNRYIRQYLPIRKKEYFKRGQRPILKDFLSSNTEKCLVCVYGHFIYVDANDYYSFFDNEYDPIVCIWYIK